MTQDKEFLGTEPVGRLLWKLAVPTVIAQLVNMLYNIVDRIYIGHIPGDGSLALTGVGELRAQGFGRFVVGHPLLEKDRFRLATLRAKNFIAGAARTDAQEEQS